MKGEDDPRTAPRRPKNDLESSQRFRKGAQELPKRPQEAPEGSKRLQELLGKRPAKNRKTWVPCRMVQKAHFGDTYEAKCSFPSVRHDAAHANAHSMVKSGFRTGWLTEAVFATCDTLISIIET